MTKAAPLTFACLTIVAALASSAFANEAATQQQAEPVSPPAAQPAPTTGDASTPAPGSLDEVICKSLDDEATGTRIQHKKKICLTRREWNDEGNVAQNTMQHLQNDGRYINGPNPGATDAPGR